MRKLAIAFAFAFLARCAFTSTPRSPVELPPLSFSPLHGSTVSIAVFDQRAGDQDPAWQKRLESDLRDALEKAGLQVAPDAPNKFELHLLRARSDFQNRQWKACVALSCRVIGAKNVEASGDACAVKSTLWARGTADGALRLAYQDALGKVLSALDSHL
ncbi:MAG TPA: hypothetical protein VF381_12425 [Thermoanaerobaculia bacterium]